MFKKKPNEEADKPCVGAEAPILSADPVKDNTELKVFGVAQTGQLQQCENKRKMKTDSDKVHNEYIDQLVKALNKTRKTGIDWKFWD